MPALVVDVAVFGVVAVIEYVRRAMCVPRLRRQQSDARNGQSICFRLSLSSSQLRETHNTRIHMIEKERKS